MALDLESPEHSLRLNGQWRMSAPSKTSLSAQFDGIDLRIAAPPPKPPTAANRVPARSSSVPLYFFHVRGGPADAEANEGLDYPDEAAARAAALVGARSLIASDVLEGILNFSSRIDVTDDGGTVLFSVSFESAVTQI